MTRLQERYDSEVRPALMQEFGYKNPMQVPRLDKIVVNMGVGEAVQDVKKIDAAVEINHHARPEVGQGFTTSSGGAKIKGKSTWNFHWGAVVMKSDDNADIVVLGACGVGGFSRMLMGSTAGQVVQHAHCPVLIVPPEDRS